MRKHKRLTTDEPAGNTENMLNLAYVEDGEVYLRYGEDGKTELCELVSDLATKKGCNYTPDEIKYGACLECECEVNLLYCLAAQAAELRERLKHYEDLEEQNRLLVLPNLKHKQTVYMIYDGRWIKKLEVNSYNIRPEFDNLLQIHLFKNGFNACCTIDDFGKTIFLTREEAEAAVKKRVKGEQNEKM